MNNEIHDSRVRYLSVTGVPRGIEWKENIVLKNEENNPQASAWQTYSLTTTRVSRTD